MRRTLLLICILGLFYAGTVHAHKVIVFGWVENGNIKVEAGFGGKKKAVNCRIEIKDKTGAILASGQTDQNGNAVIPVSPKMKTDLTLIVDAGQGHRGTWKIGADEFRDAGTDKSTQRLPEKPSDQSGSPLARIFTGLGIIMGVALLIRLLKRKRYDS